MANLLPWITRVWAGLGSLSNLMARYWTHHGTGKIFEEKHISGENSIYDFGSLVTAATWKLTLFHLYTMFQHRFILFTLTLYSLLFTLTDHEKYFLSYGFMEGTWSLESHYPNPRSCYSFPGGRGGGGRGSGNHPLHLSPICFPINWHSPLFKQLWRTADNFAQSTRWTFIVWICCINIAIKR